MIVFCSGQTRQQAQNSLLPYYIKKDINFFYSINNRYNKNIIIKIIPVHLPSGLPVMPK